MDCYCFATSSFLSNYNANVCIDRARWKFGNKTFIFYELSASKCNGYTHMLQLSLPLTLSNGNSMSGVQFREYQS